jgi:hypothetical protein
MKIESFGSMEELMARVADARSTADKCALPFQMAAQYGDCYLRLEFAEGLVIFGELLDPVVLDRPQNRQPTEEEQEELDYVQSVYAQPHMKNYRFGRHYSTACPDGELGDIHVAVIAALLSREAFEAARALEWPSDLVGEVWNQCQSVPKVARMETFKKAVELALLTAARSRS